MNNEEMLKLAAKSVYRHFADQMLESGFDPLGDSANALFLASELRLIVKPGKHKGDGCTVESQRDGIAGCTAFYDDVEYQMRYAIVRVAAEIGRLMP